MIYYCKGIIYTLSMPKINRPEDQKIYFVTLHMVDGIPCCFPFSLYKVTNQSMWVQAVLKFLLLLDFSFIIGLIAFSPLSL